MWEVLFVGTSLFLMLAMRRSLFLIAVIFFAACNTPEKQIEEAAYNYSIAMSNYRVSEAEQYCTDETRNTTLSRAYVLMGMVDSAYVASDTPASIDILGVRMVSDTVAWVRYHKMSPLTNYIDSIEVRKRNGIWLVHTPL
jgi:hypothetical protein